MVSTEMTNGSGSMAVEATAACSESVGVQGQAHAVGVRRIGQMWRGKRLSRRAKGVGVAVAGGVLVAVIAGASIPDSNGVLHGCYKKSGGQIRIVDTDIESCKLDEKTISWNAAGAGVSGYELISGETVEVAPGGLRSTFALCSAGKKPVGGGYGVNGPPPFSTYDNGPALGGVGGNQPLGWLASINNEGTGTQFLFVYAICVNAS
jgi:hypothetical protein